MPRWGEVWRIPGGGVVFVDGSGPMGRARLCSCRCGRRATLQCDYPMLHGMTCDAWLCGVCAIPAGPEVDYCPSHVVASRE